ncbi:hypothetical protein EVAR_88429_1 [Eumeta japonica]|uniref:Uncharacterized protein n=1 Tax=Eumeta variegata TaxID=151549 RepID=A0A4C1Y0X6_EUMVA|nr:hypothetical protein EVAR_88429_1 [Eumeta japonica]
MEELTCGTREAPLLESIANSFFFSVFAVEESKSNASFSESISAPFLAYVSRRQASTFTNVDQFPADGCLRTRRLQALHLTFLSTVKTTSDCMSP